MPIIRLAKTLLAAPFRSRLRPTDTSTVRFLVWPNDLDMNRHMNNGRFLTLMDLGRFDLVARSGLARAMRRNGWFPLVGSATIRFRRSLAPFRRFEIHTSVVGWDEKWIFLEQRFSRHGETVAVGLVKAVLRSRKGNVPTREIFAAVGAPAEPMPLREDLRLWLESEAARPAGT